MAEDRPSFWSIAWRLVPAWLGSGLAMTLVMYGVIEVAGGSDDDLHGPWAFGTEPLELAASLPFALLGLALLTVLTRWVLPDAADGRRPAWIPLALVLAVTGGLATLPPISFELGDFVTVGSETDDRSNGDWIAWLAAAALIRYIPWRVPAQARAPLPGRRLLAAVLGGAAALVALLAAPFAYATFHPVVLNQGHCGDDGCGPGHRPHLSLHLARQSGAPVELRELEIEGVPPGTRVIFERWVDGVYQEGEKPTKPVRLPATLPPYDASSRTFDVEVALEPDDRTACSPRSARVSHVRLRYVVHGREVTDRRKLEEPTVLRAACPRPR